uniref:Uncharacterized protein n=1 Tax=Rhizophora mucronata TaxID=61149 RepID=A0A2P2NX14_RHIMU
MWWIQGEMGTSSGESTVQLLLETVRLLPPSTNTLLAAVVIKSEECLQTELPSTMVFLEIVWFSDWHTPIVCH